MKRPEKQFTSENARLFVINGGEIEPTPELVERTRRLLEVCESLGVGFAYWNERLYPKLDDLLDCQVFSAAEEAFGLQISDAVYEETCARTFGDLVHFYDDQITAIAARRAREEAKLTNAPCATQAAFYLLRRRLRDAGVSYHQAHDLSPNALNLRLTETQAVKFADSLRCEYGLSLWFDRVTRNGVRTGTLVSTFLLATGIAVGIVVALCNDMVSGSRFWGGFLGFVVWALCGKAFAHGINRRSHLRFRKGICSHQTLGDVARELASAVQAPLTAQTAFN